MSATSFSSQNNSTQAIRKVMRSKRNALSLAEQQSAAQQLSLTLQTLDVIRSAKHIAVYLANDGEICLQPFIDWCWQHNKKVYIPRIHPFSVGQLLFSAYQQNTTLVKNSYGIAEPKLDVRAVLPLRQLDIILTPLVAFDHTGNRLGMGGGYYDRTLNQWHRAYRPNHIKKNYPIGIGHDCQQVAQLPLQPWDIPLPEIITPSQRIIG